MTFYFDIKHVPQWGSILKRVYVFVPLLFVLQSCMPMGETLDKNLSPFYRYGTGVDKNKVFYCATSLGSSPKEVKDIDIESFKVISRFWAKDKNAVYNITTRYTDVDIKSFVVKSINENSKYPENYLLSDKNHVYYLDASRPQDKMLTILGGADPATFVHWGLKGFNRWAKDKNHVYCYWKMFDADPASFEPVNTRFAKDKNFLYVGERDNIQTLKINTDKLVELGIYYVYADDTVYFYDSTKNPLAVISDIKDTLSITILYANRWLRADGRLYFNGHPYSDTSIDAANIHPVGYAYFYDKRNIYFCPFAGDKLTAVKHADVATFEVLGKSYYAKDKNHAYYSGKVIDGANPHYFYYDENDNYAYSGQNRYKDGKLKK